MIRRTQVLLWAAAGLVGLGIMAHLLAPILTPFILGLVLAYFLDPLADRLEQWGVSRLLAAGLILSLLTCGVLALLLFGLPFLVKNILNFIADLPRKLALLQNWIEPYSDGLGQDTLLVNLTEWAQTIVSAGSLFTQGLGALNVIAMIFITPVVTFYLLKDWDKFIAAIDTHIVQRYCPPAQIELLHRLFRDIDSTLGAFARGQLSVCVLLGVFYSIGLSWLGLDGAIVVGMIAGLVSFIPYAGAVLGALLAFGLALAQYGFALDSLLWTGAVFVFGQFLEGNVLTPYLVGDRVRLHPVWVIFALLAFGQLFGFLGLLLALPLAATLGAAVRFFGQAWPRQPH